MVLYAFSHEKAVSDFSDAEWTRLRSYLPTSKAGGRPRTHFLRDVLEAIFYVLWMINAEPPFEQRLRADGADQRDLHRGGHDAPDAEATREVSMNLTARP